MAQVGEPMAQVGEQLHVLVLRVHSNARKQGVFGVHI
jgi:hypothetical protein